MCHKQYLYLACYTDTCERPRISRAKMELSCQSVDEALAAGTRAGCTHFRKPPYVVCNNM